MIYFANKVRKLIKKACEEAIMHATFQDTQRWQKANELARLVMEGKDARPLAEEISLEYQTEVDEARKIVLERRMQNFCGFD